MRIIIILLLFGILYSCNQEIEKPDNLIPEDKMKEIVKDMYIYKNLEEINYIKNKEKEPEDITLAVLNMHQVNLDAFEASYQYYTVNDASFDEFLQDIKDELLQSEYAPNRDTISK